MSSQTPADTRAAIKRLAGWTKVFLWAVAILVAILVPVACAVLWQIRPYLQESYAAWDAGNILVAYMDQNAGDWPNGWRDVEEFVASYPVLLRFNADEPNYFDRLQTHVSIDWGFDPRAPGEPVPQPVKAADGSPIACGLRDPNGMVRAYLHSNPPDPRRQPSP